MCYLVFVLLFLQKKDNTFLNLYKQAREQNKDDVKDEHWKNREMLAEQGKQDLLQWDED